MPHPRRPAWAHALIPVALVGIVLSMSCIGGAAIVSAASIVTIVRGGTFEGLCGSVIAVAALVAGFVALIATRAGYDRLMDPRAWHLYYRRREECPFCGYTMRGRDSRRCPECGQ